MYICTHFFKSLQFKFELELLKAWNNLHILTFTLEENPFLINNDMKVI